jgi:hypothetical protein
MGTKNKPDQFDAYEMALDDEPMFTLLARDPSAPSLLILWAERRLGAIEDKVAPISDIAKCVRAIDCAEEMRAWREANEGKWKQAPLFDLEQQGTPDKPDVITYYKTCDIEE